MISKLLEFLLHLSTSVEFSIEFLEDLVNYKTSKGWGKGVALWETIFLDKRVQGAIRAMEETKVGIVVHKVKIVN
jgi:hypothetical protein